MSGQQGLTFEQGKRLFENDGLGSYYPASTIARPRSSRRSPTA